MYFSRIDLIFLKLRWYREIKFALMFRANFFIYFFRMAYIKDLMKTNIYDVNDTIAIVGSCLKSMQPKGFERVCEL